MKKLTAEWVSKAEDDYRAARNLLRGRPLLRDQVGFHCQQTAEKYLKALWQEFGMTIDRTHDITLLLDRLIPTDKTLRSLRRGTRTLTRYAVEYRYPGLKSTGSQLTRALQKATRIREEMRERLGLRTCKAK
jgi:HEPN domain-containing protein